MKINAFRCVAAALMLAAAAFSAPVRAQAPTMFPFVLPWDDATPGTATDVSSLNAKPAGLHGYIVAKGGHFVESKTGARVRFLGTNFAAKDAFPSHEDAEKVAARVAKLGINIVRLHHMDNDSWGPGSSIWDPAYKDHQHIDAAQLDRLDYLVSQFKKNGVYVNINLHVSRQFTEDDGFPVSVTDIPTPFDKRVDNYDRRMIILQEDYARDLLTHVNPYTKMAYTDDPCVAVIEINNENSLLDQGLGPGAGLDALPEPFRGELVRLWNDWLTKKYGTDAKLQAAWLAGVTPLGPPINGHGRWKIDLQKGAGATMTFGEEAETTPGLSAPETVFHVSQSDGTDWHVQVNQAGLDFRNGQTYTVTFWAKADKKRQIPIWATLEREDWHNIGLNATARLTPVWQQFRYVFDAHDVAPNSNRVIFAVGQEVGNVWIAGLTVTPGAAGAGLQPGQSLSDRSVDIPVFGTRPQRSDWIAFLTDTERSYAGEMRMYLKNSLHVKANVIDTQISYGGLSGLNREAYMEFADNHAYWQHPSFPHRLWDAQDWNIDNTPLVAALASGSGGTLRDLAEYRVAGKPYSVSEYNHPAPSDFQAEMMPIYATFAAFQDWDMIYLFDYGDYGTGAANDKMKGYFDTNSSPAKTAFLPAAAIIFRSGEIAPVGSSETLSVTQAQLRSGMAADSQWRSAARGKRPDFFAHRLAISQSAAKSSRVVTAVGPPTASSLQVSDGKALPAIYKAISPTAQAIVGYVGGQTVTAGPATITFGSFGNNFAAVTLTQMPNKSRLLTLVGKVENQGMVWNAAHNSVGDQWGHGPTVAEGIPATVTLKTTGRPHIYALDGTGKRVTPVPVTYAENAAVFTVGPQYKTLWYEIAP